MKLKWIIIIVACTLLILTGGLLLVYSASTCAGEDLHNYCVEQSERESAQFKAYKVDKLEDYMFWVAEYEEGTTYQELFVFEKARLFGVFDIGRYTTLYHLKSSEGQQVSSLLFDVNENGQVDETKAIVFFSSNPSKITYYRIGFQENGKFGELNGGVSQEEPFVIGMTGVGSGEHIHRVYEGAIFYDENYNIIEEEGNVEKLKNK